MIQISDSLSVVSKDHPCKHCGKPKHKHLVEDMMNGVFCVSNPNDSRRFEPARTVLVFQGEEYELT